MSRSGSGRRSRWRPTSPSLIGMACATRSTIQGAGPRPAQQSSYKIDPSAMTSLASPILPAKPAKRARASFPAHGAAAPSAAAPFRCSLVAAGPGVPSPGQGEAAGLAHEVCVEQEVDEDAALWLLERLEHRDPQDELDDGLRLRCSLRGSTPGPELPPMQRPRGSEFSNSLVNCGCGPRRAPEPSSPSASRRLDG